MLPSFAVCPPRMLRGCSRERMGSGGPRGLQILRSGASCVRGGFDSHAFPPWRRVATALLLAALSGLPARPAAAAAALAHPGAAPPPQPATPSVRDSVRAPAAALRPDTVRVLPAPAPADSVPASRI